MASKPKHVSLREKRNRPPDGEPWIWLTRELLESDAWRTMPIYTQRFVERLMLEQMAHAGTENGQLIVTYKDCFAWEVAGTRRLIKLAQADAIMRGLVYQTQSGKFVPGRGRKPNTFGLGWLPGHDGGAAPNRWKAWRVPASRPRSPHAKRLSTLPGARPVPGKIYKVVPTREPENGRSKRIKVPTREPAKVPTREPKTNRGKSVEDFPLPPGWSRRVEGRACRIYTEPRLINGSDKPRPVAVPIVDSPLVGTEAERAALAELKAFKE